MSHQFLNCLISIQRVKYVKYMETSDFVILSDIGVIFKLSDTLSACGGTGPK